MNFLNTLERRFGHLAIPRLVHLVAILNAVVFLAGQINPAFISKLALDRTAVLQGEYWRLFTYIFIPQTTSFLLFLLGFLMMWTIGTGLEQVWGKFRLNLFYLTGMIGTTIAAFLFDARYSNFMLNLSLFFAFAWFYGDMHVAIFGIIPVKVRWAAWFTAALLGIQFFASPMSYRAALLMGLLNYLLFFLPLMLSKRVHDFQVARRRETFQAASTPEQTPLYCCHVCKRTDLEHPSLTFRVGRDGNDYCEEHLPKANDAPLG